MAHLPAVLVDHAHCEKKAASHALTLISQYPEQTPIIAPLIALAQEELRHFGQVCRLLKKRAITLTVDGGDPYVKALMGLARHSRLERLVDRLLIASLVEARSAERLGLLAQGLAAEDSPDPALAPFYTRLAVTEAGHHTLFVRLAKKLAEAAEVDARLEALAHEEQHIMAAQPVAPRIH